MDDMTNCNYKWRIPVESTAVTPLTIPGVEPPYLTWRNREERRAAEKKLRKLHPGKPIVHIQFGSGR